MCLSTLKIKKKNPTTYQFPVQSRIIVMSVFCWVQWLRDAHPVLSYFNRNLSYNKLTEIDPSAFAELLNLQEV